jgi:hypothetical protein
MERAGATPPRGIRPPDLVELVERPGPFATVWIGRTGTGAWGARADDVAAGDARSALIEAGAPDAVVAAVGDALDAVSGGAQGAVVVAVEEGVVLVEELPSAPRRDRAVWAAQPSLSPVIEHRQADIPMIVVLADRAGADIVVTETGGRETTVEVEGDDSPITKSAPGGWSQRRFQQRAEDSWEHNAAEVAERVRVLAAEVNPDLVVLGGDVRAVELIGDALPVELHGVTRRITSGRAADGSEERREHDVEVLVRTVVATETAELLKAFDQEEGRGERAANGMVATLQALQRSQVDVLLVHDDPDDDRTAWFAGEPGMVAVDRAVLEGLGLDGLQSGRAVDVAIAEALRTGAAVRIVPTRTSVEDGIAAILRWSEGSSPG